MRSDAAKALATFPEGVVTAVDPDGYPVSVRQRSLRCDASTGEILVAWPQNIAVIEGPANVLCHSHDEKLWNLKALQLRGRLERRGDDWVFITSAVTAHSSMVVALGRAANSNRAAGNRYLDYRGIARPQVNWAAVKDIHRRAPRGQQQC